MATSLYDLSVANYLQTLSGVIGFLEEGLTHFQANNVDLNEIVDTRLHADMLPFRFQIQSVAHHSRGAIEGVKSGVFQPPPPIPALDYAGLQKLVADARDALQRLTPAEVNACEGKERHVSDGQFQVAVHCRALHSVLLVAEFLFSCGDRVRHPAHERRAHRQAPLHGTDAAEELRDRGGLNLARAGVRRTTAEPAMVVATITR